MAEKHESQGEASIELSREVVTAYAHASSDFNSIHMSDEAARESGFPGAVAHGMLTLGWTLTRLTQRIDLRELRALSARFAAPVPVGAMVRLLIDEPKANLLGVRVLLDDDAVVLTAKVTMGEVEDGSQSKLPCDAEIVAEPVLRVNENDAVRFARALAVGDGIFTSKTAAREAGFEALPAVPSIAFALPGLGFLPDDPANAGTPVPNPVTDAQAWTETEKPVVHAGQDFIFHRPLLVGERVRARHAIIARSDRQSASGKSLRFTKVRVLLETEDGEPITTSDINLAVIGD